MLLLRINICILCNLLFKKYMHGYFPMKNIHGHLSYMSSNFHEVTCLIGIHKPHQSLETVQCDIKEGWLPAWQCEMLCGPESHWNWWKLLKSNNNCHFMSLELFFRAYKWKKYVLKKICTGSVGKATVYSISTMTPRFLSSPSRQEPRLPLSRRNY